MARERDEDPSEQYIYTRTQAIRDKMEARGWQPVGVEVLGWLKDIDAKTVQLPTRLTRSISLGVRKEARLTPQLEYWAEKEAVKAALALKASAKMLKEEDDVDTSRKQPA